MQRSPVFPDVPYLGDIARAMVWIAGLLFVLLAAGALLAELNARGMLTLSGAIMGLAGTGKYLLAAGENGRFWMAGIFGWVILALA